MDNKRDRTPDLISYIESCGLTVNVGKNKARGNKGFFLAGNKYRIDIAKGQENILGILIHEFAHYIHYTHDKSLKSLDFVFGDLSDELLNELIEVTVSLIPKGTASSLFKMADELRHEIKCLSDFIKNDYKDFKITSRYRPIENKFFYPASYLLKYDKVKIPGKIISVETADKDFPNIDKTCLSYLKIKSKQRFLKRINSRISRLNRYYNSETELFARCLEVYFTNRKLLEIKAPNILIRLDEAISLNKIPLLTGLKKILL